MPVDGPLGGHSVHRYARPVPLDDTPEYWAGDYDGRRQTFVTYTQRLSELLHVLLPDAGIDGEITARTKSVDSFRAKLERKGTEYSDPIAEVTDLVGLRVTTYYVEDVRRVGELLSEHFQVDGDRSHVESFEDPGRFGYASNHYVIRLPHARSQLPEWRPFEDICAEVQVRTVLQHAWAAISHKLAYKNEDEVPLPLRRKLFRLSALLEAADEDFMELQQGIAAASEASSRKVSAGDLSLALDLESLRAFFDVTKRHAAYVRVGRDAGLRDLGEDRDEELPDGHLRDLLSAFTYADLTTIDEIDERFPEDAAWAEPHLSQLAEIAAGHDMTILAYAPNMLELLVLSLNRSRSDIHDFIDATRWSSEEQEVLHEFARAPLPPT
jgi:putative GTP pyrophosphokinase